MVIGSMPLADMARKERLGEWFEAYNQAVFAYLLRLTGDEDLAADLLQETFARALAALERQELPRHPYAWLCRIGGNLVIDHVRRRRPWRWRLFAASTPPPDQQVATAQTVRQCLAGLKRWEAELLIMAHCVGLSPAEIAELLNENVSTVRVRLHRARQRFRALYAKEVEL
ncbi:MAG TPA: RNA polymerase sigma factor [Herpetosiphonaceae bacterium]|nr:RNA polymerase sigma factor [Herpetosiphonaceae bacterium]